MFGKQAKKRAWLLALAVLVLALVALACGETASPTQERPSTETPIQAEETRPTAEPTPQATSTPEPTPQATSTPEPTSEPTVDTSDCTLGAAFQADVTVSDNTWIEIGQRFTKTWRIRNTGTCEWGAGYRLTFIDGDQMGGSDSVGVPETLAGEDAEISVELVAPVLVGRYRGYWQMCVNEAEYFGDRIYVQIISFSPSTPVPTARPLRPTPRTVPPTPTQPVCECSYNAYNCDDFPTQAAAQACFNYCWSLVGYDVHWLDGDGDRIACEWNP